jgi:hypothetical protein
VDDGFRAGSKFILLQLASTVKAMARRMHTFRVLTSNRDAGPSHVGSDRTLEILEDSVLVTLASSGNAFGGCL